VSTPQDVKQVAELRGHTSCVNSVAFHPSGKYLASGSNDKTIRIWDVNTQQQVAELSPIVPGQRIRVTSVAFDPTGKYLASGFNDCPVRIWDVSEVSKIAPASAAPPLPAASADQLYWQKQREKHTGHPYDFLGGYKRQRRQSKRRQSKRRQSKRRQSKRRQSKRRQRYV